MSINFSLNGIPYWDQMIELPIMVFPGGEPHVQLDRYIDPHTDLSNSNISLRIQSFNDIGKLLILSDAIYRKGGSIHTLVIPYFPGARQDHPQEGEAHTLEVYANIINNLHAKKVIVADPHSVATKEQVKNITIISQSDIWGNFVQQKTKSSGLKTMIICPDQGAKEKISAFDFKEEDSIYCSKKRDPQTGKLHSFKIPKQSFKGIHGILGDDICDGGGTFIGIAKQLKKQGISKLTLCVTHGIFSKGTDELSKYYDEIITTNSIRESYPSNIRVISIEKKTI